MNTHKKSHKLIGTDLITKKISKSESQNIIGGFNYNSGYPSGNKNLPVIYAYGWGWRTYYSR